VIGDLLALLTVTPTAIPVPRTLKLAGGQLTKSDGHDKVEEHRQDCLCYQGELGTRLTPCQAGAQPLIAHCAISG
jgi:hypothetical protein